MGSRATGSSVETVNTFDFGTQSRPRMARTPDGGWIIVYNSFELDGSLSGVVFQRFDEHGIPVGAETLVNETAASAQRDANVTILADGSWIVAWETFDENGIVLDIMQRRYDPSGEPLGGEILVNTFTADTQHRTTLTALSDGGWVVCWESLSQDGGTTGIYQQRFDADGIEIGGETLVNTTSADSQFFSDIVALADGGWVVAWSSNLQDGSSAGVYLQRFDAAGETVGTETRVNTETAGSQTDAAMTALADGGWIVVWESPDEAASVGVYMQRFDAEGARIGAETRVNASTALNQTDPEIAVLADGGWIVVWELGTMGGARLMQQRYDANGNPVGGETFVHPEDVNTNQLDPVVIGTSDGGWTISWTRDELELDGDTHVVQRHFAPDIAGTAGDDQLIGGFWAETLFGNQGDDILIGNGGDDVMVGGLGDDTYVVNSAGDDIREFVGEGHDSVTALVSYSILGDAVEELRLSGTANLSGTGNGLANVLTGNNGNNTLHANNGHDTLDGGNGNDVLNGGGGNDDLTGGEGNDRLSGGAGRDTANYAAAAGGVTVNLGLITAQITGGAGSDTVLDVENLIGSAFDDTLTGNDDANVIEGLGGDDTLDGGAGIDTVSYASAAAGVTVSLALAGPRNTIGAGIDTLSNFENLVGSAHDDTLTGNGAANVLEGGFGDDVLNGAGGVDTASYAAATGGVAVDLTLAGAQVTGNGSDTLTGIENLLGSAFDDEIRGNGANNRLDGGRGNDTILGGGGGDTLVGGIGRDILTGNGGADRFVFVEGDMGRTRSAADVIADFNSAAGDRIVLSSIDADTSTAGEQSFAFIGSAAFSGAAGELRYSDDGANTFIEADTNGDGFADFAIRVDGLVTLLGSDFVL